MIPLRVKMRGWMRYRSRDEQTVDHYQTADFEGVNLMAICGDNGTGKSSIFDAITFALYGSHRLGKQGSDELISQGEDFANVEFEFEADGARYRAARTVGRRPQDAKRALYVWDASAGEWQLIPGTEKLDSFDKVIERVVRLSEQAFRSSFLLQQGEATRFIDAKPKERFGIISSLIGLDVYKRMERLALDRAKTAKEKLDDAQKRLTPLSDATDDALLRLRAEAETARASEDLTAAALTAARACEQDSGRYAEYIAEIADAKRRVADARKALAAIDLPSLDASLTAAEEQQRQRDAAAREAEQRHKSAADAERAASDFVTQARALLKARRDVTDADAMLAGYHDQLKKLDETHERAERLAAIRDALPLARALKEKLEALERAEAAAPAIALAKLQAQLSDMQRREPFVKQAVLDADTAHTAAQKDAAELRAASERIANELALRQLSSEESVCSRCGQKIDAKRAKAEVMELKRAVAEASQAAKSAAAAEKNATTALADAKKTQAEREGEATALQRSLQQARQDLDSRDRLQGEAETARAEALQHAPADLATSLRDAPSAKDVGRAIGAHGTAPKDAEAARRELDALNKVAGAAQQLKRQRAQQSEDVARIERDLGARADDAPQAEREHAEAKAALKNAQDALAGARRSADAGADGVKNARLAADAAKEARSQHESAAQKWTDVRQLREADAAKIPGEHRIDRMRAQAAVTAAVDAMQRAQDARGKADQAAGQMEARIDQRRATEGEIETTGVRLTRLRKMAKLLGKDGLQGALVVSALQTITSHGNAFLQRLTGGSLRLDLAPGGADELVLRATDASCMTQTADVQALSGSQKFRVAVAIASGIGQYAGAGGMRSIIIDEGFSSLDDKSQDLMVSELKNLATHMDRVIVVSHLEPFKDRSNFPDQLVVEQRGNSSQIRRVS